MAGTPAVPSTPDNLDSILDRMVIKESSGNPNAKGKAGEVGLLQVKPDVAAKYGISPVLLTHPDVNRYVAKRYLSDLLTEFKGSVPKALAAYNAGPGRVARGDIPASTRSYVEGILGTAPASTPTPSNVLELPSVYKGMPPASSSNTLELPSVYKPDSKPTFSSNMMFASPGARSPLSKMRLGGIEGTAYADEMPPPPGPRVGSAPDGRPVYRLPSGGMVIGPAAAAATPAAAPTPKEPLAARAASWLPTVGQFGGETLGAIGGAAIPGAGETGLPEYAGAVSGGASGSGLGAEAENVIRRHYGLPPVSVGGETAWGGLGSALGGLLPLVPRFRKAAALAKATGISWAEALEKATQLETQLGGTLGTGTRVAKMLKDAPATSLQTAYKATKEQGIQELETETSKVLRPYLHKMTPLSSVQALNGLAGKKLELAGKPLRRAIEQEFAAQPMTVGRVQRLLTIVRQLEADVPEKNRLARSALNDIETALKADRDAVIGRTASAELDTIDTHFERQLQRFPEGPVKQAFTLPQAAETIISAKPADTSRVLEVIGEMSRTGRIEMLRKGVATRLFQDAESATAQNPAERMAALEKAIGKINIDVFDKLYGAGSKAEWLKAADTLTKAQRKLLENPTQAQALTEAVRDYLKAPGILAGFLHFFGHRALWGMIMMVGGAEFGIREVAYSGAGLLGVEGYEMLAHSKPAMALLMKAANATNAHTQARLIISAFSTALRTGGESYYANDPSR